jgi:hypothetical protein
MVTLRAWVIALASIRQTIFPVYRERLQAKRRLREHAWRCADYLIRGAAAGTRSLFRTDEFDARACWMS